ncbi:hypothetical protein [Zavarzinella formosa]|uniref:hypothetical protein n=1 Tax=Zavarzinella formosa TaxID=360055 RepID=UPI0003070AEB|nr:hypothetical protein [Zavarzinella formosa]
MLRKLFFTLALSTLLMGVVFADTYGEKVTAVDAKGNTISITVDKKEKSFKVDPKAQFLSQVKAGKRLNVTALKDGLKSVKSGDDVVLTTELKDGEEIVTKVVVSPAVLAPKKKAEPKKVEPKKE